MPFKCQHKPDCATILNKEPELFDASMPCIVNRDGHGEDWGNNADALENVTCYHCGAPAEWEEE